MIEIKAVEKDGELAGKLLQYVEECSWDDCKLNKFNSQKNQNKSAEKYKIKVSKKHKST